MFFRLVANVGQRKNSESPWGIELQTCGFRKKTSLSISLPSSKLTFSRSYIYNLYAFDIADPSSIQDACHMNFIIDLAHRRVSVAQWLEHRSTESEGLSEGTQNFLFVPRSWQDENTSFSISLPSSKLTISRISIYISFFIVVLNWFRRNTSKLVSIFLSPMKTTTNSLFLAAFLVHSEATMGFGPSNYFEEPITFWLIETLR